MSELGLAVGAVIAGRYAVGPRIGTGGMGAVYEGTHIVTRRPCAIKLMLGHTADREEMRQRFFRESRALAQIHSEYIVSVLDAGIDPDTHVPFLVMERLHGVDLGQLVNARGGLPARDVLLYLWHAALALDKTHRASIVHRDLKASNLLLTQREDGSPLDKVLDFGVAKMMRMDATSEGGTQAVGTPLYMAPEQFRGKGRVSPATDIYSLGMLAYLLLVGRHYWREEREACENPFAFATIAAQGPVEPASVRAGRAKVALSAEFDAWFARATAIRADARFPSAIAAITELSVALGLALPSPPPPKVTIPPLRVVDLGRSRDGRTENIGPGALQNSGVMLTAAMSFTDSELYSAVSQSGEGTEMPLSMTAGSKEVSPRGRRVWPWFSAVAVLCAAVASAFVLGFFNRPPAVLSKGFGRTPVVEKMELAPRPAPPAPPAPAPEPLLLTPADLELATPEAAAVPAQRPQRPTGRSRVRASHTKESVTPSSEIPEFREPEPIPAAPADSKRETLYRRD